MASRVILIVEGPTGAGKSTLVDRLSKKLVLPVRHCGSPPSKLKDPKVIEEWFGDALLSRTSNGIILDRWVYSNRVYGTALKNQVVLNAEAVRRLEQKVLDAGVIRVTLYLQASPDSLRRRISRRDKPTWDVLRRPGVLEKLCAGYDQSFETCNLPKIKLTTVKPSATYAEAMAFINQEIISHG